MPTPAEIAKQVADERAAQAALQALAASLGLVNVSTQEVKKALDDIAKAAAATQATKDANEKLAAAAAAALAKQIEKDEKDAAKQQEDQYRAAAKAAAQLAKDLEATAKAAQRSQKEIDAAFDKEQKDAEKKAKPEDKGEKLDVGPLAGLGIALASLNQIIGATQVAFQALEAPITTLAGSMRPFVEALSPNTVKQFDFALRDLHATIGVALTPAFNVLTGLLRDAAGAIDPLAHALAPVLQHITETLGGVFLTVVETLASTFTTLMPIIDLLAQVLDFAATQFKLLSEVMQIGLLPLQLAFAVLAAVLKPVQEVFNWISSTLADVFKAVQVVMEALVTTIVQLVSALLGGVTLKDTLARLTDIVHQVIKAFILMAAWIATLVGLTGFVANLEKALEGPGQGEKAAIQSPAIKGLEQIGKDLAVAASLAGGQGGKEKSDNQWLADIAAELKAMKNGPDLAKTIEDAAKAAFVSALVTFEVWLASWLPGVAAPQPGTKHRPAK